MMWLWGIIGVVVIGTIVLLLRRRGPRLQSSQQKQLRKAWQKVQQHTDLHRKILDADAVLTQLLGMLGYSGSTADKLRQAEHYLPNINAVWDAHKLRNRVAHEPNIQLSDQTVRKAMQAFENVLEKFCR